MIERRLNSVTMEYLPTLTLKNVRKLAEMKRVRSSDTSNLIYIFYCFNHRFNQFLSSSTQKNSGIFKCQNF